MVEREPRTVDTNAIREYARLVIDQSHDILTLDYNAINNVLVPALISLQKESVNSAPSTESNPMPLERELGVTLFFDVVNFCFKDPVSKDEYTYETHGRKIKRSSALFTALKESDVDWNNLISVAALSPEKWRKITQLSPSNSLYLGEERGIRIRGFAKKLYEHGFRTVSDFLVFTELDTEIMLPVLASSGYFDDEFLKRAQLTVRMLDEVYKSRKLPGFKYTEVLTAMADYRIPQVYYNEGIVKPSHLLLQKLLAEEPIKPYSPEERALRSTVITVSKLVADVMGITEGDVDTLEWTLSQKMAKAGKLPIPHMLVATDKY